jgi:hypothetical protein
MNNTGEMPDALYLMVMHILDTYLGKKEPMEGVCFDAVGASLRERQVLTDYLVFLDRPDRDRMVGDHVILTDHSGLILTDVWRTLRTSGDQFSTLVEYRKPNLLTYHPIWVVTLSHLKQVPSQLKHLY